MAFLEILTTSFLFIYCYSCCSLDWIISSGPSLNLLVLSSAWFDLYWIPLVKFSFQILYSSDLRFLLCCFYIFYLFAKILLLFTCFLLSLLEIFIVVVLKFCQVIHIPLFHYVWLLVLYLVPFGGLYFPVSSLSLTLYWHPCIRKSWHLYQSSWSGPTQAKNITN